MVHRVPKASMCLVFNKRKYAKLVHGKHLSPSKKTFLVQSKAIFVLSRERERERERENICVQICRGQARPVMLTENVYQHNF